MLILITIFFLSRKKLPIRALYIETIHSSLPVAFDVTAIYCITVKTNFYKRPPEYTIMKEHRLYTEISMHRLC